MTTPEIRHMIKFTASEASVYKALTEIKQLAQWWIPDTRGESKVGQTLEFWVGTFCAAKLEVTALEPGRRIVWRALDGGNADWTGTEMEFRIDSRKGVTRLHFRHSGWRAEVEDFPYYSMSWAVFLAVSLKDYLEKGKGHPFPNQWNSP